MPNSSVNLSSFSEQFATASLTGLLTTRALRIDGKEYTLLSVNPDATKLEKLEADYFREALLKLSVTSPVIIDFANLSSINENVVLGVVGVFKKLKQVNQELFVSGSVPVTSKIQRITGNLATIFDPKDVQHGEIDLTRSQALSLALLKALDELLKSQANFRLDTASITPNRPKPSTSTCVFLPKEGHLQILVEGGPINTDQLNVNTIRAQYKSDLTGAKVVVDLTDCMKFHNDDAGHLLMLHFALKRAGGTLYIQYRDDSACANNHALQNAVNTRQLSRI